MPKFQMVWSEHAALQKILIQDSRVTTMLILFFDSKRVIHPEHVPEDQTVNATFYIQVLDHLCTHIACVRPEMWRDRKFFFSIIMCVRTLQRSPSSFQSKKECHS